MKKLLLIGSNGNLAKSIIDELEFFKILILKISRKQINFLNKYSKIKLNKFLDKNNPDFIVNCVGLFENNKVDFDKIFKINTKVSWDLIQYYLTNNKKKVSIVVVGSSAHNKPRKNYILYTASKASLHSIVKSSKELFKKTQIKLNIIHPPAMKTNMRKNFFKKNKLLLNKNKEVEPKKIARKIIQSFNL